MLFQISPKTILNGPLDKSVDSNGGLGPNRLQAIACINDEPIRLRTYASSGLIRLNVNSIWK